MGAARVFVGPTQYRKKTRASQSPRQRHDSLLIESGGPSLRDPPDSTLSENGGTRKASARYGPSTRQTKLRNKMGGEGTGNRKADHQRELR